MEGLRVRFLFLVPVKWDCNKTKWVNYIWNEYVIEFIPRNWIEERFRVRWFVDKWEWSEASGVTPRDGGTWNGGLNQESGWMTLFCLLPIFDYFSFSLLILLLVPLFHAFFRFSLCFLLRFLFFSLCLSRSYHPRFLLSFLNWVL